MEVRLRLEAERALFERPEFDRDLISYDLITPAAARGVLDAVYRCEAMRWIIDAIRILHPVRRECVEERGRRVLMLCDVGYLVEAHVGLATGAPENTTAQAVAMFERALRSAPAPCLGRAGCATAATLIDPTRPIAAAPGTRGTVDHGWLLYGTGSGGDHRPRFFQAIAIDGLVRVPAPDSPLLFA